MFQQKKSYLLYFNDKIQKRLLINHCNPPRKQQNNHDGSLCIDFIQILAADVIIVRQQTLENKSKLKHSVD